MTVEVRDKGTHVEASINPREIYADQNHSSFTKGMLVWACVQSQSDHGYEMTLGVKHCRAFVPFKNIDDELNYGNKLRLKFTKLSIYRIFPQRSENLCGV